MRRRRRHISAPWPRILSMSGRGIAGRGGAQRVVMWHRFSQCGSAWCCLEVCFPRAVHRSSVLGHARPVSAKKVCTLSGRTLAKGRTRNTDAFPFLGRRCSCTRTCFGWRQAISQPSMRSEFCIGMANRTPL